MPESSTVDHGLAGIAPGAERDPAALGRVLGGVVEQVGDDLHQPGRRRRARSAIPAGGRRSVSSWRRASISGRLVSTAFCSTVSRSTRSGRSSILPWVMRLMSSRSSTRWIICLSWRSMMWRALSSGLRLVRQAHDLERVADRRERIAQLVGEGGEELVLAAVGAAQRLLDRLARGDVDDRAEHARRRHRRCGRPRRAPRSSGCCDRARPRGTRSASRCRAVERRPRSRALTTSRSSGWTWAKNDLRGSSRGTGSL